MTNYKFADIAPIEDKDVKETIQELLVDPGFMHAVKYIMPNIDWGMFSKQMLQYDSKAAFQSGMIAPTVWGLARKASSSINSSEWQNYTDGKSHLVISNHRDIILDAGILNILLNEKGLDTTEIAIGDNLLIHPWIEKLVRLNKSFLVKRGVSIRQMLEVSTHMSEYIHHTITEKKISIWLAQREGRAKDSNDKTQESLIKMLGLSSKKDTFIEHIKELNILPLSISYEYDPCDYLKALEFQLKRDNPEYKKSQVDDLRNMEIGILGFKGDIRFTFGKEINSRLDGVENVGKKEQPAAIATIIDQEIHRNYGLFPCNYIAYDLSEGTNQFNDKYTAEQANKFKEYIQLQLDKIEIENKDDSFLISKFLGMYSNTLRNHLIATR
ncbi:MAG: hypothetical protein RL662_2080 [Bacteroidota bacterium]|jgi:hypothetical protein